MNAVQKFMKASKTSSIEFQLADLMEEVEAQMIKLDPEVSGQDDEIYQLEKIWNHLNEAHSELLTYIKKF